MISGSDVFIKRTAALAPSSEWHDIASGSHSVQFYEDDGFLLNSLSRWFDDGLSGFGACIFIGTQEHRLGVEERLALRGVDFASLSLQGRYNFLDAEDTLSSFMVDEWPDESLFRETIGRVVTRASHHGEIRAFGEMVALLWTRGNRRAAIRLEEIWNEYLNNHPLTLCCAYPLSGFVSQDDPSLFLTVCGQHGSVLPAESYSALETAAERLRSVSLLQQKARLLDGEKAGRVLAEKSLNLRQQELADFFENALEGLQQLGPDAQVMWANPAQLNMLGYSYSEYVGHPFADYFSDCRRFDEFWRRLTQREVIYDFQAALRCKNGSVKHVLIHANSSWDSETFIQTRCFIHDVTERVQLEAELKRTIGELAEADQRKNEFLAMLGHELRNPLAAVLDAIATAEGDAKRRRQALAIARRQADQLARLMDDLLDIGRITQGRIALKKAVIAIEMILNQAIDEAQCLITPGQHQLIVEIAPKAAEGWLEADPARLRQVIGNLIHNAAKFTPPSGRIQVRADICDNELVLSVSDSGVGISSDLLPHVFDLFTQAERSLDRSHGGLGIGLTLVKRLVEMHGGRVEAASDGPGLGSEFTVHLPSITAERARNLTVEGRSKSKGTLRILIVEDNLDAAEALGMLLELLGHKPTMVSDGLAAIEAASKGDFDLALVDIGLPEIDGYEVARRIKPLPSAKRMKLVALTGYGQDSDKRRALAAGFDEHLTKPVKVDRLQELLNRTTN